MYDNDTCKWPWSLRNKIVKSAQRWYCVCILVKIIFFLTFVMVLHEIFLLFKCWSYFYNWYFVWDKYQVWAIDLIANVVECRFCTQGICAQFRTTRSSGILDLSCYLENSVFHLLIKNTAPPNLHTMTSIAGDWEMVTDKVNLIFY